MKTTVRWDLFFTLAVTVCLMFPETRLQGAQPDPQGGRLTDPPSFIEEKQPDPSSAKQSTMSADLQKRMKTRISVNFRAASMEDVIKTLTEQADIDIVKSPEVIGDVSATLTDVPLDEALDSILSVHGYGYTTSYSIVRIVPKSELLADSVAYRTQIFHIDYADVDSVNKAVTDVLSPQGTIAMNIETRHLAITDTEDRLKVVEEFITAMDREIPQILVEARIYDVSCSVFLDLGFDWSAGTFTLFDATTGLPVTGRTEPFFGGVFSSTISQVPKSLFGLTLGVLNEDVDFSATLRAARDDIKARLLANPKILVLNGSQASIKIVSEIPYQELTQTTGGGNIGTTAFKEVGIELQVTPRITRDDKISLKLTTIFGIQTGSVSLAIPTGLTTVSSPQPIVDKREAITHALIHDGQTVVIGGLRKRDVVQEISRVPLLADIPLLGRLFQFKGERTINSELVIFITPHIIRDPSLIPSDARKFDAIDSELREPEPPTTTFDCGKVHGASSTAPCSCETVVDEPLTMTDDGEAPDNTGDGENEDEESVAGVAELTGVYVIEVPGDSAMARAGIVAGDAIQAVDGRKVANVADLRRELERAQGKTVELRVGGARARKIKLEIE